MYHTQIAQQENGKMCIVEGCKNKVMAKGFCSKHYSQMRKYNKIFKYSYMDRTNHIELYDDHAEIYLINRDNEICAKALIDLEDVDKVKKYKMAQNRASKKHILLYIK